MARTIRIYRTWCGEDMAESDSYHPTLTKAREDLRKFYGVKGDITLDDEGGWEGRQIDDDGSERHDVHLEALDIELTREGLCRAFKIIPNR